MYINRLPFEEPLLLRPEVGAGRDATGWGLRLLPVAPTDEAGAAAAGAGAGTNTGALAAICETLAPGPACQVKLCSLACDGVGAVPLSYEASQHIHGGLIS